MMARVCCSLWLVTILAKHQFAFGAFGDFVRLCDLDSSIVQSLAMHEENGSVFILENNSSFKANNTRRLPETRISTVVTAIIVESAYRNSFLRALITRGSNDTHRNYTVIAQVRECACNQISAQSAYCPSDKEMCGLAVDGSISCFTTTTRVSLLRNCWPVVVMWYGIVLLFLFFTEQGRHARRYVLTTVCNSGFNARVVDRVLEEARGNPRRGRWMARRFSGEENNAGVAPHFEDTHSDDDDARRPQRLALKTKRFSRPPGTEDDDDACNCSICFVPLQDGDRVGALQCQHSFHVDCLKLWIRRKNSCPLCQTPNVATLFQNDNSAEQFHSASEQRDQTQSNLEVAPVFHGEQNPDRPVARRVIRRIYGRVR
jgi:hypothetical protein